MSEPEPSSTIAILTQDKAPPKFKAKDWLASVTFGEGFRRSIRLMQNNFRMLVFIFFIGGLTLSIILIPVNSIIAALDTLLVLEILAPVPDFINLINLLRMNLLWGLVQSFVILTGVVIMNTYTVDYVFKTEPSLHLLSSQNVPTRFPLSSTIAAGIALAVMLTLASLFPVFSLILFTLFFFIPVLLVINQGVIGNSFSQSIRMRRKHWQRILGALILGYLLVLFAGTLGVTLYLNVESLLAYNGILLGLAGPILLSILTQIPIAMVAPLVPLFSIAFFSGAREASRMKQYEKYIQQHQKPHEALSSYMLDRAPIEDKQIACRHCGNRIAANLKFCTYCGTPISNSSEPT